MFFKKNRNKDKKETDFLKDYKNGASSVISLENISFAYPQGSPVLKNLDFKVEPKQKVGLAAPNGSGKTTLFQVVMGLLKPSSGSIKFFGKEAKKEEDFFDIRKKVGLVFQDPDDQLFCPTVLEDVAFGPLNLGQSF